MFPFEIVFCELFTFVICENMVEVVSELFLRKVINPICLSAYISVLVQVWFPDAAVEVVVPTKVECPGYDVGFLLFC